MNPTTKTTTRPAARPSDDATGAAPTRPLAHAIALRLLTAKGGDAAGLKAYVAGAGLAEAMVDVLEELTRRARSMRVEFEDLAGQRQPEPAAPPLEVPQAPPIPPQVRHPGY